jgi:type II secretory pathway component GspD/PulD (secretin)
MCLLFVCVGAGSLLSAQITLRENNISIEDIINKIEDSSEYRFLYSKKMVDVTQKVSVSVQNEDVKSVLDKLFARTDID